MPDQLQLRGGTTTEHNSFTGVSREVTVDTTKKTLVVHDGSTAGGTPLMKESGGNSASSVGIGTGGTNAINIDSSQKVGIGVASPTFDSGGGLHLRGPSGGQTRLHMTTSGSGDAATDGFYIISLGAESGSASGEVMLMQVENKALRFGANNEEKMRIDGLGNVGIGTTTIADDADHCKLAISGQSGTAAGILIFQDTSNNEDGMIFADNGSLFIAADRDNSTADSTIRFRIDGSSEKMRIDHVGRLLIGTTAPLMNENGFNEIYLAGKTEGAAIHFSDANNNVQGGIFTSDQSNKMFIRTITNHPIVFRTNNTDRMMIDQSGNLGVQNTNPQGQMHIGPADNSNHEAMIVLNNGGATGQEAGIEFRYESDTTPRAKIHVNSSDKIIRFSTDNTEQIRINSDGDLRFIKSDSSNYPTQQIKWSNDSTTTNGFYISQHSDRNGRIWHEQGLSLVFGTSNAERMTITPNGHVGIGTTTPDLLGATTDSTYLAVIESSGSRRGKLLLGDNQNVDTGGIGDIHFVGHYQNTGHKEMATIKATAQGSTSGQRGADLVFETKQNGVAQIAHAMTIKSDGRVFIGNNNPAASANADDLCIGDNDSSGETGITLGSNLASGIRWADGQNNSAAVLEYQHNNTRMVLATEGGTRLILDGDGIKLGGEVASANGLDDYEEGSFTPTLTCQNSLLSATYHSQDGKYTKIGNFVHFQIYVRLASKSGGSGHLRISNLPFTSSSASGAAYGGAVVAYTYNWDGTTLDRCMIGTGSTQVQLFIGQSSGTNTDAGAGNLNSDTQIRIFGSYRV